MVGLRFTNKYIKNYTFHPVVFHLIKVALNQGTQCNLGPMVPRYHPSTEAFLVMHSPGVWGKRSVEEWENLDFIKTRSTKLI